MRLLVLVLALAACDDTPEQPAEPEPVANDFSIHEWGFIAHHFADADDTSRFVATSPGSFAPPQIGLHGLSGIGRAGGKPILYVHLPDGTESAQFTASLVLGQGGEFVEHWPEGEIQGTRLMWNVSARPGTCSAQGRYATRDHQRCNGIRDGYCEAAELGAYETTDGACLTVAGADWNHLFYRAQAPGPVPLRFEPTEAGNRIHNNASDPIPSKLIRIRRHDSRAETRVHIFDAPAPGESLVLPDETETAASFASTQLRAALAGLGMTDDEASAFMVAWESELLGKTGDEPDAAPFQFGVPPSALRSKSDSLIYFMPESSVNRLLRLEVTPAPQEVRRAILVRVDLNPHPGGTIGLGNLGTIGHSYGRASSSVQVRTAALDVQGPLPEEVVRRVLRRHMNQVRVCHTSARDEDAVDGTLALRFSISRTGALRRPSIDSELADSITQCVLRAAQGWTFPSVDAPVQVAHTYAFRRNE